MQERGKSSKATSFRARVIYMRAKIRGPRRATEAAAETDRRAIAAALASADVSEKCAAATAVAVALRAAARSEGAEATRCEGAEGLLRLLFSCVSNCVPDLIRSFPEFPWFFYAFRDFSDFVCAFGDLLVVRGVPLGGCRPPGPSAKICCDHRGRLPRRNKPAGNG